MTQLTPREIVSELDRHIIGQTEAKRAVAVALRNRWRRLQIPEGMRNEVVPKNILMIGPTGVGKTEIARRLARLTHAPFIKVEATKFTEVGYVGRDVEQIIRDLVDQAINMMRQKLKHDVMSRAESSALERILDALVGATASPETRDKFRQLVQTGQLGDREVEIEVQDNSPQTSPVMEIPGMPGAHMGMFNLSDMFGKVMGSRTKNKVLCVPEALRCLIEEESDRLIDHDQLVASAIDAVENKGIVFLDEVDKICARQESRSGDVSREGVQRDLLPLIEGTVVATKHGQVKTDHILFIASGAFHVAKPSDLLPELQGRLPIRVELKPLAKEDMVRILTEPEASLLKQYKALLETESVHIDFSGSAIHAIAELAEEVNRSVENIGARRLHAMLERLLEDISFSASDNPNKTHKIDRDMVYGALGDLVKSRDISRFVL